MIETARVTDVVAREADQIGLRGESGAKTRFQIGSAHAVRDMDIRNVQNALGADAGNADAGMSKFEPVGFYESEPGGERG